MQLNTRVVCFGLVSCIVCIALSCKKVDKIIQDVPTPQSSFTVQVYDSFSKAKKNALVNYIDSSFYFQNLSESGTNISYKWNFGDGASSEDRAPSHAYKSIGQYIVTLITSRSNIAHDTARATVSVIIGQKDFLVTPTSSTSAIDIVESSDNTLTLLGSAYDAKMFPNNPYSFIMRLDKSLRQTAIKSFPAQTQLNAIALCNDGNLILTGTTTGNVKRNELIKMTLAGEVLWSKKIGDNSFTHVMQTPDGGYLLTGSRNINEPINNKYFSTLLVKTDANGTVIWENVFDNNFIIEQSTNAEAGDNGYIVAGIKKRDLGKAPGCSYCDSVGIVKVDDQGKIVWRNAIEWGLNTDRFGVVRISKQANGNFNVIGSAVNGLYLFSATGKFLDRKLTVSPGFCNASLTGGNIAVLQTEWGNGFRAVLGGYADNGSALWSVRVNSSQTMPHKGIYSADSWPVSVKPLANGGAIILANKIDRDNYGNITTITMVDKNGNVF